VVLIPYQRFKISAAVIVPATLALSHAQSDLNMANALPIAIACFLLLTVLPFLPLLSGPALRRFMAAFTSLDADLENRAIVFAPFGNGKRRFLEEVP
jgi:hypothetical protein